MYFQHQPQSLPSRRHTENHPVQNQPAANRYQRSISTRMRVTLAITVATSLILLAGLVLLPLTGTLVAQEPEAYAATYVVTSLADDFVSPGTPTCGAVCTLRDAARTAAENPGHDLITFAEGLTGTIALVTVLTVNEVTIEGPGADLLALSIEGSDAFNRRVLSTIGTVTLRGLTIQRTGTGRGGGITNSGNLTIEESTIKDASYNGAGGAIFNGSTASLSISDSTVSNNLATTQGGGIMNLTGPLTVTRTLFDGNRATGAVNQGAAIRNGGGIVIIVDSQFTAHASVALANLNGGNISITDSLFEENASGGILNEGANSVVEVFNSEFVRNRSSAITNGDSTIQEPTTAITVTNSTFTENVASGGGAIHNRMGGQFTLLSSTLQGNWAIFAGGGAIYNERFARIMVQDSTIDGNWVGEGANFGGGIANLSGGVFVLERSTVSNNRADEVTTGIINNFDSCGGIHNDGNGRTASDPTHMTIRNSTISDNVALKDGGGICARSGSGAGTSVVVIEYSTIAYNRVLVPKEDDGGGGIFLLGGDVILTGVILANNTRGADGELDNLFQHATLPGTITSQGHNLSDSAIPGSVASDRGATPAGLAPLAENGGPTATHALYKGSAAIDGANNTGCPATDQRGTTRPQDGDGNGSAICDIGAFESDSELEEPESPDSSDTMYLPVVQS